MHPFAHLLTADELSRLAGGIIFDRGVEYQRDEVVKELTVADSAIEAVVTGGQEYRVRFWREAGNTLAYSCSCPYFADGSRFCKHLVAVGLEWIERTDGGKRYTPQPPPEVPLTWRITAREAALCGNDMANRLTNVRELINRVTGIADGQQKEVTFLERRTTEAILDALTDMLFRGEAQAVYRECEYFLRAIRQASVKCYGSNASSYLIQRLFMLHFAAAQHVHVRKEYLSDLLAGWRADWPPGLPQFYAPLFGLKGDKLYAEIRRRRASGAMLRLELVPPSQPRHQEPLPPPEPPEPRFADSLQLRLHLEKEDYKCVNLRIECGGVAYDDQFALKAEPLPALQAWLRALIQPASLVSVAEINGLYSTRRLRAERLPNGMVRFSVDSQADSSRPSERGLDVVMPLARLVEGVYHGIRAFTGNQLKGVERWLAANPLAFSIIEFRVFVPAAPEMLECGLPEVKQEIRVDNGPPLNQNDNTEEDGTDCINWRELVESVKKSGRHTLAICSCGWADCRMEDPYEIMHSGDLTRLRVEPSRRLPNGCEYVFFRRQYTEAVRTALRQAVAIHQTWLAGPKDGDFDPGTLLTNVGISGLTEAELLDYHRRIADFCMRMRPRLTPHKVTSETAHVVGLPGRDTHG